MGTTQLQQSDVPNWVEDAHSFSFLCLSSNSRCLGLVFSTLHFPSLGGRFVSQSPCAGSMGAWAPTQLLHGLTLASWGGLGCTGVSSHCCCYKCFLIIKVLLHMFNSWILGCGCFHPLFPSA